MMGMSPRLGYSLGSLTTRQTLESLLKVINGESVTGTDPNYEQKVIGWMLEIFESARKGFDYIASGEFKASLFLPLEIRDPVKYAWDFVERLSKDEAKAERFVRAMEKALNGYQDAMAQHQTRTLTFDSDELRSEAVEILQMLERAASMGYYQFPPASDLTRRAAA